MTKHQDEMSYQRRLVEKTEFDRLEYVMFHADHMVYVIKDLAPGFFWVDHDNDRIAMGRQTWATLNHDIAALHGLVGDMAKGSGGMRFVNMDSNVDMSRAARREATDMRMDVIHAKDEVTILTEKCESLILKVVGLGKTPTALQLNIFHRDYADIRTEYDRLVERIKHLEAIIQVAGIKIATAA